MTRPFVKPYPFLFSIKRNLVIAVSVGVLIGIITYLISDDRIIQKSLIISKTSLSLLFGFITFSCIIIIFQILPKLFFSETVKENWTILKELGITSLLLCVIIISNFSSLILISKEPSTILTIDIFIEVVISGVIIGLIPSAIVVWANYTIKLKENLKQAEQHNKKLQKVLQFQKDDDITISIPSDNKTETICFNPKDLLFIKSDGNYIEIYLNETDQINKLIHRASLQTIEKKLSIHPGIIRTHRSYIVNCINIKSSKGTARNYLLFFSKIEQSIPVARNKFKAFNETIRSLKTIQNK